MKVPTDPGLILNIRLLGFLPFYLAITPLSLSLLPLIICMKDTAIAFDLQSPVQRPGLLHFI